MDIKEIEHTKLLLKSGRITPGHWFRFGLEGDRWGHSGGIYSFPTTDEISLNDPDCICLLITAFPPGDQTPRLVSLTDLLKQWNLVFFDIYAPIKPYEPKPESKPEPRPEKPAPSPPKQHPEMENWGFWKTMLYWLTQ